MIMPSSERPCSLSARTIGRALVLTLLLAAGWSALSLEARAQAPENEEMLYRVETTDGNVSIVTLVSEDDEQIVLDTRQVGWVTMARADIQRMQEVDPDRMRDGEYWFENLQPTRYLLALNAIGIPEGSGYCQNTWIFLNNVNFGVSNNFSIGDGTVPVLLFGVSALPVWLLPKMSISVPNERAPERRRRRGGRRGALRGRNPISRLGSSH